MWANKKQTGFTIVETLIVLAITAFLFLSTTLLVQGQIDRSQQKDAIVQLESSVRNTLNDVSNGYYPDPGQNLSCQTSGNSVTSALVSAAGNAIGTSQACVYAGKHITFNSDGIYVDTLAAAASNTNMPAIGAMKPVTGLTQILSYKWGITPVSPGGDFYILNTVYSVGGNFASGAQQVALFDNLGSVITTQKKYCFINGTDHSSITLSGDGSLQVSSQQKDPAC